LNFSDTFEFFSLESIQAKGSAVVNKDAAKLVSDEAKLAKKPTSSTLSADVSADLSKLTADASALLSDLSSNASTTSLFNAISAVGTANSTDSKTQTDVATMETDITNNLNAAGTAANAAYTTDVTALENLY
jgi:hypothetical protein